MAYSPREITRLLDQLGLVLGKGFQDGIAALTSRAQIAQLTRAVETGNIDAVLKAAGMRAGAFQEMTEAVRTAYSEGGQFAVASNVPKRLGMVFDISNPRAEMWLQRTYYELIRDISTAQRDAIRTVLTTGMARGRNPREMGLDIVGRIGKDGVRTGGIIGLNGPQAEALRKAGDELRTLNPNYFTRTRRDHRFDGVVKKAMREGKPLSEANVSRLTGRYSDRLKELRGATIGRTEALKALNGSADEAMRQVVDEKLAPKEAIKRIWHHSYSKGERPGHLAMGKELQTRPMDEAFINPYTNAAMMYPGDGPASEVINCRCWVEHEVDFVAAEKADAPNLAGLAKPVTGAVQGKTSGLLRSLLQRTGGKKLDDPIKEARRLKANEASRRAKAKAQAKKLAEAKETAAKKIAEAEKLAAKRRAEILAKKRAEEEQLEILRKKRNEASRKSKEKARLKKKAEADAKAGRVPDKKPGLADDAAAKKKAEDLLKEAEAAQKKIDDFLAKKAAEARAKMKATEAARKAARKAEEAREAAAKAAEKAEDAKAALKEAKRLKANEASRLSKAKAKAKKAGVPFGDPLLASKMPQPLNTPGLKADPFAALNKMKTNARRNKQIAKFEQYMAKNQPGSVFLKKGLYEQPGDFFLKDINKYMGQAQQVRDKTQGWNPFRKFQFLPSSEANGYTAHPWNTTISYVQRSGSTLTDFKVSEIDDWLKKAVDRGNRQYGQRHFTFNQDMNLHASYRYGATPGTDAHDFLVWIHEMGHNIHYAAKNKKPFVFLKKSVETNWKARSLTEYGGQDEMEYVAEHFVLWLLDYDTLVAVRPQIAKYIDDVVNAALEW